MEMDRSEKPKQSALIRQPWWWVVPEEAGGPKARVEGVQMEPGGLQ